jgi:hypothetical protein
MKANAWFMVNRGAVKGDRTLIFLYSAVGFRRNILYTKAGVGRVNRLRPPRCFVWTECEIAFSRKKGAAASPLSLTH